MKEVTFAKIEKINENVGAWSNNLLPQDLFNECYELALYDTESRNEQDQLAQKSSYIRMFERVKSYEEGQKAMYGWLAADAFQHSGKATKFCSSFKSLVRR